MKDRGIERDEGVDVDVQIKETKRVKGEEERKKGEKKKSGCFSLKQMRMQMSVLIVPMVTMSSMKPLFVPTEDI
eukprot:CAMPEP_0197474894 /NCGR_PEP_ID=MMETSP1309-20131121/6325_1 /TAXON_ID=464262 /ORGANISM="Genus nov. species nov., Strain RCC998" /LENGTH=73 /DNA_ID=CAMNT_0043014719 /DNA_START=54 /DNA_END=272 /DNA_ORIENTATION=-